MNLINNRYVFITAIVLATYLLGLMCGLLWKDLPYLSFKKELSLGEITNFILTLFVAITVPFYLSKKISNKRIEKDILIEGCNKLDDELDELKKLIESAYVTHNRIKKDLAERIILKTRNISNRLNLLKGSISAYNSQAKIKDTMDNLVANQTTSWADLTFNLRDNVRKITEANYLSTEKSLYTYSENISKLKMYLNDA